MAARFWGRLCSTTFFMASVMLPGCTADSKERGPSESAESGPALSGAIVEPEPRWFTERATETGLQLVHFNGASGNFYYPEILPPGVGLLDYDNDGDLDVYVVQGRILGKSTPGAVSISREAGLPLSGRLFRNDLQVHQDGTRTLRFTDVTAQSGIEAREYGLGVAIGDINNDGWVDVYLTNFGPNQMFRNNGDGTFSDVSNDSGTTNWPMFGVSAAFLDYDRDGWLDLYMANNVHYTIENLTKCPNVTGGQDYCPPQVYGGLPDRLYRNQGNGRFVDVSASALVGGKFGPALGIATADYNGDGWIDIFVANDGEEDLLWSNQRNGTFKEIGLIAGVAVTAEGRAEASMGVDAGDFDNDGDEDLIMTELTGQGSNLYINDGSAAFQDRSSASSLGAFSLRYTGFGTAWFDFDNDGWLDTLAVNGTVVALEGRESDPFPYDQRKLLLRNLANGRFEDVTSRAGAAFGLSEVGRGAAFGDIDNDGDVDVLIGNNSGPVRLLINNIGNSNHWLGLRLVGAGTSRDALGARVAVIRQNGPTLWRRARTDGSYGSANDPRVLVGLGASAESPQLEVRWPSGRVEKWSQIPMDRWTTLIEGSGH